MPVLAILAPNHVLSVSPVPTLWASLVGKEVPNEGQKTPHRPQNNQNNNKYIHHFYLAFSHHLGVHFIPQEIHMNVDVRMDLFFVKGVILGGPDLVGNAGTKLPQTVEIRLSQANSRVAGLELSMLLCNKNKELVIAVNSAHDDIVHRTDAGHKRFG